MKCFHRRERRLKTQKRIFIRVLAKKVFHWGEKKGFQSGFKRGGFSTVFISENLTKKKEKEKKKKRFGPRLERGCWQTPLRRKGLFERKGNPIWCGGRVEIYLQELEGKSASKGSLERGRGSRQMG